MQQLGGLNHEKISPTTSLVKVKAISQGPNADLLRKLVDVLYEQAERREEYDEEPFSAEDLAAIQEGGRGLQAGRIYHAWKIMKRNVVCELLRLTLSLPGKKAIETD